ncbi:MAG: phosphoglucosamine mutase [Candidatus Bathyarchaeota archaeon B23]|nr:MAG: phosphoglucosamine mutase [Candidatus Bathyarchaeota archaeon B23]
MRGLFGTSGIRGVVNVELTPQLALEVGKAIATLHRGGVLVVGRDTRPSGEMLEASLIAGAASCGCDVEALGLAPTPLTAYTTRALSADTGVSVTASHNPPEYNGLKPFDSSGMAYGEERRRAVEEVIRSEAYTPSEWSGIGLVEEIEATPLYLDAILRDLELQRAWRVACDLMNGATAVTAPEALKAAGCEGVYLNANPDGYFPSGVPEPRGETLRRLGEVVRSSEAQVGFAFDGDGDRVMFVDEDGVAPTPDRVLAAYAAYVVERCRGGVIVTHVGASMCVDEAVRLAGGRVIRTRVGDAYVAEALMRRGGVFGGEPVGAWIHPDVHPCPDGLLSALRLLGALEERDVSLSEFVAEIPEYPLLRGKVRCPNPLKGRVMALLRERWGEHLGGVLSTSTVDGLRLELGDGWLLMRPSGTEPVIRLTAEAESRSRAEELMERGRGLVEEAVRRSGG